MIQCKKHPGICNNTSSAPHINQSQAHRTISQTPPLTSFQEFFELGEDESASPFLTAMAKKIGKNLSLKRSLLALFFLLLSFLEYLFSEERSSSSLYLNLGTPPLAFTYLLVGTPALIAAIEDILIKKDINIDVLMTISAFGALALGRPYEGALLLVLFALSGSLEDLVTLKAKNAVAYIHTIAPTKATVILDDNALFEKAVQDIEIGAHILVRTGEVVPLDGVVTSGNGTVSFAHITGESRENEIIIGEKVSSGSRVVQGSLVIKVTTHQVDSTVSKIINLITEAQASKPKLSQAFERFGQIYSLSVITLSCLILLFFPLIAHIPLQGPQGALVRAMSFLITASPCALFIAVPIAYLSALGSAVKKGAILKGGKVFDQLLMCTAVAFDKTGTLTQGELEMQKIIALSQLEKRRYTDFEIISLAASVERHVVHPIARAVVTKAKALHLPLFEVSSVHVHAGRGVEADICFQDDLQSKGMFSSYKEHSKELSFHLLLRAASNEELEEFKKILSYEDKKSCVVFEISYKTVSPQMALHSEKYLLLFEDTLRAESAKTVTELKEMGKTVLMISGDSESIAKKVAHEIGIDEWKAEMKPQEKLHIVSQLSQQTNNGLVMVGDGLNDAPALARATVGISMGQLSSASARDVSDIVLLHDNLTLISWLFQKAQSTKTIVRQNLFIALLAIIVGTTSSLYGAIPLWVAVLLHEGSTFIVGLNALRLLR